MKLKEGFILSEVCGDFIGVAADDAGKSFSGMMKLNKTAAFITGKLQSDTTVDELVAAVTEKYDVTEELARQNVISTVETFQRVNLIEK